MYDPYQLQKQLFETAQAQSAALSQATDLRAAAHPPPYKPGEGSIGPGTFVSNGNPPSPT